MPLSRWLALCLVAATVQNAHSAGRPFRVAVVVDGPWERNADVLKSFESETATLAHEEADVTFPAAKAFIGDWTLPAVHGAIDRALADREVDLVLALGVLAAHDACHRASLAKPVVAAGVIDPATQGLPAKNGASGVENLAYVTVPSAYRRDLRAFLEVTRFRHVAILGNGYLFDADEVRRGVLAAATPDIFPKMARRLAVTLHRVIRGEDAGTLPTTFSVGEQLYINAATMRAIDATPSWAALTEAEMVGGEGTMPGRQLSLVSVVDEAIAANRDLAAATHEVSAGAEEVARARSKLLPQAELDADDTVIDRDRAAAALGSQPEREVTGDVSVSQVLFSERALASHAIQKHLQRAREKALQADRLDVGRAAARAYLDVLRAGTFERIRRENLRLTRRAT